MTAFLLWTVTHNGHHLPSLMSRRSALSWPCRFIPQRCHSNNAVYVPAKWTISRAVIYYAEQLLLKSKSNKNVWGDCKFYSSFSLHIQNRNGENNVVVTLFLFCSKQSERQKDHKAQTTPDPQCRIQYRMVYILSVHITLRRDGCCEPVETVLSSSKH